ncbi:MAG: ATP-binding protein [Magnetospirillum sp.]|nr:ATP-binding protein [Magnetospirillum sp.]
MILSPARRRLRDRLLPDTVVGRTALVLVAALLVSASVALALFAVQRQEALSIIGGRAAAERVAGLVTVAEQLAPSIRQETMSSLDTPRFRVGWGTHPVALDNEDFGLAAFVHSVLEKGLEDRTLRVSLKPGPLGGPTTGMGRGRFMHVGGGQTLGPAIRISVLLRDGSWLNVMAPLDRGESLWRPRFILPLVLALILVTAVALLAVRRATRPFATFAAAAERLGVDVSAPPMDEVGPREVRQAVQAFNIMQSRVVRFVQDRTQMLAAISHDLKTPITRLRLRAEFMDDDDQRTKMLADLEDMESMIASTLAFARDDATSEPRVRMDLGAMVQGMIEDLDDLGAKCAYDGPDSLVTEARPAALKRALANLIDNAIKYGGCARVGLGSDGNEVRITIDDDGPGIPEDSFERVFAPFVRLEASRSRDTGGTGLGMAVARAAIRAHGGDIVLTNRPKGGLRITVTLPQG